MQKQSFADVLQNGFKIGVLKRFANFTGKHRRWSLFLNNLQASCNFVKKRLQHRSFPVNFAKFPKTPFLQNTSGWLLLVLTGALLRPLQLILYYQQIYFFLAYVKILSIHVFWFIQSCSFFMLGVLFLAFFVMSFTEAATGGVL